MMNDDRLNELIHRVNGASGVPQGLGVNVQPEDRPSGWVCPVCHTEAAQRWEPLTLNGQPIGGVKWLVLEDGTPMPVRVQAAEIVERNDDGTAKRIYETQHCFQCFDSWQRRKMMQEIRANVPQLERKKDA